MAKRGFYFMLAAMTAGVVLLCSACATNTAGAAGAANSGSVSMYGTLDTGVMVVH